MALREKLEHYFDRLWPICRSIAGPGFRQSLDILSDWMPTERLEFPTGAQVFDWTVPKEWEPRQAYFVDPLGKRHADFATNNLHLVSHSIPFSGEVGWEELAPRLHTTPRLPEAIPYRTSYYKEDWGFCLSQTEKESLPTEGRYQVHIDAQLTPGKLVLGEAVIPGETDEEILLSSYLCHPSMANNELSGPLTLAALHERVKSWPNRRFTYRFVLLAETIGAIAYLSVRGEELKRRLRAGYVITCVGDPGPFTYKRSRRRDSLADRAACGVLRGTAHRIIAFSPTGSDERQYGSPGFDLPVGSLMRTMYGEFAEYHTSFDNKAFISFESLAESVMMYERVLQAIEKNRIWISKTPYGEPQLGRRGLYPNLGAGTDAQEEVLAMMWLMNLADGQHDILAMAERSGLPIEKIAAAAEKAAAAGLLETR